MKDHVLAQDEKDRIDTQIEWLKYAVVELRKAYPLSLKEALPTAAQMLVARSGEQLETDYTGPDEIDM